MPGGSRCKVVVPGVRFILVVCRSNSRRARWMFYSRQIVCMYSQVDVLSLKENFALYITLASAFIIMTQIKYIYTCLHLF